MSSSARSRIVYPLAGKVTSTRQRRFERGKVDSQLALDANPHYFQVLFWLLRLRFMSSEQISRVLQPARQRSAVYDLLRRLYDAGYIARFAIPARKRWGREQVYGAVRAIHCLDRQGAAYLAERYRISRSEIDWKPRDNQKHGFLEHRLATNNVLITMQRGARRAGWQFDILQTEREIHKRGGHDWVVDLATGKRKPVKPDAVCRLALTPSDQSTWLSLEVDMGTEAEKKIKRKFRLHRAHYLSGKYQQRHGTDRNRVPFVVADVRDPLLVRPPSKEDWRRRVRERVLTLKRWAEEEGMRQHFWFAASYDLTEETVWQNSVWLKPLAAGPLAFV